MCSLLCCDLYVAEQHEDISCPAQVDLTGCNTVSDAAIHSLCNASEDLENVCLRQCFRVGKGALAYLSKLPNLRRLVLDRVLGVTSPALADFAIRGWEARGGHRSQLHTLVESFTTDLAKVCAPVDAAHSSGSHPTDPAATVSAATPLSQALQAPPPQQTQQEAGFHSASDVLVFDFSSNGAGSACAAPPPAAGHAQQEVLDWDDAAAAGGGALASPGRSHDHGSMHVSQIGMHGITARHHDDYFWDERACVPLALSGGGGCGRVAAGCAGGEMTSKSPAMASGQHQSSPDSQLPCLPLTHLDVSNCLKLTTMDGVFAAARCLTHVNLAGCPHVSSASVGILGVACGQRLRHVNLSGCHNVTNTGVQALAARCPALRSLLLNKCRNAVDDDTLGAVSKACTQLIRLGINSCVHVSDAGLAHIGALQQLSYLDIEFCHTVTDAGLMHVLEGCPELQDVNLRMLVHLTEATMHILGTRWPRLRRLRVGGVDTPANLSRLVRPTVAALPKNQLHVSW